MSLTATAVVLGLLVLMAMKANWARPLGAFVCVVFGLVLGASSVGPAINAVVADLGTSIWQALQGL
jgi:hypothetical protein